MFMEFSDWDFRIGRPIANETFLKALLTYGSYDSYEFFCPDVFHLDKFTEKVRNLIKEPHLLERIQPSLQIALSESINEKKYDVFHLGDFTYFMPYLINIRNRYARNPFPITGVTHSLDGVFMNLRYLELILSGLAPYDGIICTSNAAEKCVGKGLERVSELLEINSKKDFKADARLKQIPLGIDDNLFDEMDRYSARSFFNIPENMTVALSVGRLSLRNKNDWSPILEYLARSYDRGELENLIFIIAGGAEESDISLLESLITNMGLEKRVMLLPNFDTEIKTKLYKAADFYISIIDNFQETFGLNIIEAMASGLPVIASDFSGYHELVTHGKDGFLIPTIGSSALPEFLTENMGILDPTITKLFLAQTVSVDLAAIHKSITALYSNKNLIKEMGLAAKENARKYRWEGIIKSYESFWSDLSIEAQKTSFKNINKKSDLLTGGFQNNFSHYPTKIISNNDLVSLTDVGRSAINETFTLTKYNDITACLFPELENLILNKLRESDQSIEALKKHADDKLHTSEGQTEFHILWLMKHGVITL